MRDRIRSRLPAFCLAAAAAAGLVLAFPPFSMGILSWCALSPLFWGVFRARTSREAAELGAVAGFLFYAVSLRWFRSIFGVSSVGFFAMLALFWALWAWAAHRWVKGGGEGLVPAAWPRAVGGCVVSSLLWLGIEFFRSEAWALQFPWLALGYAHWTEFPGSLLQAASLWGVYGNSFWIVLGNAFLGMALSVPGRRLRAGMALAGLALPVFLWVLSQRVAPAPGAGRSPEARVACVQSESYQLEVFRRHSLRASGAGLIVWPEYQIIVLPGQRTSLERRLGDIARECRATLVASCGEFFGTEKKGGRKRARNFAWVFGPDGRPLGEYQKQHPIPLVEKMFLEPGRSSPVFPTAWGEMGVAICYDLDFTDTARKLCAAGAAFLAVPNLDPALWGEVQHIQHSAMAPVRAVEARRWIVRAASSGLSQIISPSGRVLQEMGFGGEGVLAGSLDVSPRELSPYHRCGWRVVEWASFTGWGFLGAVLWKSLRRGRPGGAGRGEGDVAGF